MRKFSIVLALCLFALAFSAEAWARGGRMGGGGCGMRGGGMMGASMQMGGMNGGMKGGMKGNGCCKKEKSVEKTAVKSTPGTDEMSWPQDEKFLAETAQMRSAYDRKVQDLQLVLASDRIDEDKAKSLQSEINQLRDQLAEKALQSTIEYRKNNPDWRQQIELPKGESSDGGCCS